MSLPAPFDRWLAEALDRPLPQETRAPCDTCVQCAGTVQRAAPGRPVALATFNPSTKCCTYLPLLRNWQVGRILADGDRSLARGRASVRSRIEAQVAVTPLGLLWPQAYEDAYDAADDRVFGQDEHLRCPHYLDVDGGLCGIWTHRNATCSTWFCRFERGARGRTLWEAVRAMLEFAEEALAWHAMDQVGLSPEVRALQEDVDDPDVCLSGEKPITEAVRRRLWGAWYGREEAFYRACHEIVGTPDWAEVMRVGGGRLRRRLETLVEAQDDHDNEAIPPFVSPGELETALEQAEAVWVHTYRAYDPVRLPRPAVPVLESAGVLETEDLRERLEAAGVTVDDATLRRWLDAEVLHASLPFEDGDGP